MLDVDDRAGSKNLIEPLKRLGLPARKAHNDFGDCHPDLVFEGRGERGRAVSIAVEHKTLRECVQALRTNRLQGYQMVGMRQFDYCYLFIEGELLYDCHGVLQRRQGRRKLVPLEGRMTVGELLKRVYVLHLCGGLNPWWTATREDTLQALSALYHTWTDTDLDAHKSHLAIYQAPSLAPVSPFRASIASFPGIGHRTSAAVERAFHGSLRAAVGASVEEWAAIPVGERGTTRRLGRVVAARIVQHCRGEL
jgi:hypothetical protein